MTNNAVFRHIGMNRTASDLTWMKSATKNPSFLPDPAYVLGRFPVLENTRQIAENLNSGAFTGGVISTLFLICSVWVRSAAASAAAFSFSRDHRFSKERRSEAETHGTSKLRVEPLDNINLEMDGT